MKRKDLKNKKCVCPYWNKLKEAELKEFKKHEHLKYCPFCGNELSLGFTITIYECTNPERDYGDFDDYGFATSSKLYYSQKKVEEYVFETRTERSDFWEKTLKKQFEKVAYPTYIEVNHYLIMFGTVNATGGHSQFGKEEYKFWNGKSLDKRGLQ